MALDDRLADNTVLAMIELVRVLDSFRQAGAVQVNFWSLYTDDKTLGTEIKQLAEATSHIKLALRGK